MSKLLFDESPLVVQPTLAKAIGLHEAIILQQINYWVNLQSGGEFIGEEHWIYNSLSEWQKQFPFLSESSIYRAIENLEEVRLIKTGNFNKRKGDKTKWYTINHETVDLLQALIDNEKWALAREQKKQSVPRWNTSFQDGTPSRQDGTTLPEITSEITSYIIATPFSTNEELSLEEQTDEIDEPDEIEFVTPEQAERRTSEQAKASIANTLSLSGKSPPSPSLKMKKGFDVWTQFQSVWRDLTGNKYATVPKTLKNRIVGCSEQDSSFGYFDNALRTFLSGVENGKIECVPIFLVGEWEKEVANHHVRATQENRTLEMQRLLYRESFVNMSPLPT